MNTENVNTQDAATEAVKSSPLLDEIRSEGEYRWQTKDWHYDNAETMESFLECHLPEEIEITLQDESYAEIFMNGVTYSVDASGDGDSYHHKVSFSII